MSGVINMKRKLKSTLSIILTVAMVLSIFVPSLNAFAAEPIRELPVVYIGGKGHRLLNADGTQLYPFEKSMAESVKEKAGPILAEIPGALITDNWDSYCDTAVESIAEIYEDFIPNKDGEVVDGSYAVGTSAIKNKTENFGLYDFTFAYDWRLDPLYTAQKLNQYINDVLTATGKEKVNLIGRCYGANVVTAYFQQFGYDKVAQCVLYVPTASGSALIGELFAGRIALDPDSVEAWLYNNPLFGSGAGDDDNDILGLVLSLVSVLNEVNALGLGTEALEKIYAKVKDNILPRMVLSTYGALPSFWAMVSDKYYSEAKQIAFSGREQEYAKFIEKIDYQHYNVVNRAEEIYAKAQENGVIISVISKYNIPFVPVIESSVIQADDSVETSSSSLGATCAPYGQVLESEYIESVKAKGLGKYISPDNKIDASTCLFPDRTWFVRDIKHSEFPDSIDCLVVKIFNDQINVNSDENYPQYLQWNVKSRTLAPLEEETENEKDQILKRSHIQKMIDFLTRLIKQIITLIKSKLG